MQMPNTLRRFIAAAALLLTPAMYLLAQQPEELPKHERQQLEALNEPPLEQLAKSSPNVRFYRFTWLRTFDNPIVIRVAVDSKDRADVVLKRGSGKSGYGVGKLLSSRRRHLDNRKLLVSAFLTTIEQADLRNLPSREKVDEVQLDGADWTFEVAENNRYHFVWRWSPGHSSKLRELGLMFCKLAGFRPYYDEVY